MSGKIQNRPILAESDSDVELLKKILVNLSPQGTSNGGATAGGTKKSIGKAATATSISFED